MSFKRLLIANRGEIAIRVMEAASENAAFARRCAEAGMRFIGRQPDVLELFGDKVRARQFAQQCGVPVLAGTAFAVDDVIDPADSRRWISGALRSTPPPARRTAKKYPLVDCW